MELSEIAKESRRAYKRKWQAANKEKVREYNIRYWENRARKEQEQQNAETKHNK